MVVVRPNAVIRAPLSSFDKPCNRGHKKYWYFNYCKLPTPGPCVCTRTHTYTRVRLISNTENVPPVVVDKDITWELVMQQNKWAAEWNARVRECLFIVFQKAIGFGCLQKQEGCRMFNHVLKLVLQMLNLGTEILLFHLSGKELSVSELQKNISCWSFVACGAQRQYQSVAAIK